MLTQERYDQIRREGGCTFEERGKVCRALVNEGGKYCPRHAALMAAQADRVATKSRTPTAARRPQ